jgi:hypothetical protein
MDPTLQIIMKQLRELKNKINQDKMESNTGAITSA